MNIVNEQVKHILYGGGKVICQETDYLSIQFSEQYGIKKFLYPDAFEVKRQVNSYDVGNYLD